MKFYTNKIRMLEMCLPKFGGKRCGVGGMRRKMRTKKGEKKEGRWSKNKVGVETVI